MDPDGLDLLLKEEPGSPAGMDFDALLMPQVLDRCGVCHQPCPPEEAKSLASCLRCSSKVHGRCDRRAADALKVGWVGSRFKSGAQGGCCMAGRAPKNTPPQERQQQACQAADPPPRPFSCPCRPAAAFVGFWAWCLCVCEGS